jgi:NAD(P)-dependent dehydrogenase (short-subunit alcohol dehydrogenase family)
VPEGDPSPLIFSPDPGGKPVPSAWCWRPSPAAFPAIESLPSAPFVALDLERGLAPNVAPMNTAQHKIGSRFGARSTADEVVQGLDLSGRLAVVTGGYSGLGLETTRTLARAGAHVVVPARRVASAEAAFRDLPGVEVDELDLADLDSVRAFSARFLASGRSIDLLIAAAGIMACPETRVGPGWEAQFATNHLGHFALVNLLWSALARAGGARVVSVSSGAHRMSGIRWEDVQFDRGYDRWVAYGQSKTATALFAVHLDAIGRQHGVRAFAVDPGSILTPLQRHLSKEEMVAAGWIDNHGNLADPSFKTPQQGAATLVWAATAPELEGLGGVYCTDCDVAEPAATDADDTGVSAHAIDPDEAARLWSLSTQLTNTDTTTPPGDADAGAR